MLLQKQQQRIFFRNKSCGHRTALISAWLIAPNTNGAHRKHSDVAAECVIMLLSPFHLFRQESTSI